MEFDTERPLRIYQCEDSIDGILSAIYEAGISRYGHKYIRIEPQIEGAANNYILFSEYVMVETDAKKAEKVARAVRTKISQRAYQYMMYAVSSDAADRGDAAYQFLTYGFSMGDKVCDSLGLPPVKRVFELQRAVGNEAHFSLEFLRFKEVWENPRLMLAVFEPKNRVLPSVMEHFRDRFSGEFFIIFDKTHKEAGIHLPESMAGKQSMEIRLLSKEEVVALEKMGEKEEDYPELWKTFFHAIAIEERKNEKLQKNLMPLHYRKYVTEFLE
ncbi:MAG: TIGR03915 family putative DNA repair protein [Lachnospiraceae bacterium]|nr:TIGR03915 family putative DNA repair protein [Lachnospiraceae bacterium]